MSIIFNKLKEFKVAVAIAGIGPQSNKFLSQYIFIQTYNKHQEYFDEQA